MLLLLLLLNIYLNIYLIKQNQLNKIHIKKSRTGEGMSSNGWAPLEISKAVLFIFLSFSLIHDFYT